MNYHHFGYKQESLKKAIAQHQHVKQRILWGGWGGGWQKGHRQRTCDEVVVNDQCKMCKNCQCYYQQVARSPSPIEPKPLNCHYVSHYHLSFATIVTIIVDFFVIKPFISKSKSTPHDDVV
jgi:hypothetical protein